MSDEASVGVYQCLNCGREYEFDGEKVQCWCDRQQTVVVKPCAICGGPIRTAEICHDCAESTDGDAFTTNWGKGSDIDLWEDDDA